MTVLYILVPIAILLVVIAIWVFNWAVNNGQYDDLDSPAHSILFDEDDPAHLAAQGRSKAASTPDQGANQSDDKTAQADDDRPA
ncbi:cytochrome oxidase maturation protein, cbb3-type [Halopseudomonas sabulinigri]|uniref:Cytochrome oxidase maturation protein, cbb3-type n=1 Tax=Halopseudomonas sabulinigri TaxID=472181 RepID=A0A1H1LAF2_9GAMM|nr:cbb3-type cytochrome oxidase assembly protein CcoS [Halopseudomonas sabulinigri]SDR71564.1 cytochrome oxidase maturation protein, cbb3-type [Halopseudomonas sabulinigri]